MPSLSFSGFIKVPPRKGSVEARRGPLPFSREPCPGRKRCYSPRGFHTQARRTRRRRKIPKSPPSPPLANGTHGRGSALFQGFPCRCCGKRIKHSVFRFVTEIALTFRIHADDIAQAETGIRISPADSRDADAVETFRKKHFRKMRAECGAADAGDTDGQPGVQCAGYSGRLRRNIHGWIQCLKFLKGRDGYERAHTVNRSLFPPAERATVPERMRAPDSDSTDGPFRSALRRRRSRGRGSSPRKVHRIPR